MENAVLRSSPESAGATSIASVSRAIRCFLACLLFLSPDISSSLQAGGKPRSAELQKEAKRTITLKIAMAEPFGIGIDGKRQVQKLNGLVSDAFSRAFGIVFRIIKWETWKIDKTRNTLRGMFYDLKNKNDPGEADVLVGVLGPSDPTDAPTGIADYFTGTILIRLGQPGSAVPIAMHELGHIFGAVDLDEKNTAMNPRDPGSRFDSFSARVISLNKNRSFHTQTFPCPAELTGQVMAEYEGRAALGRSEPRIHLFLAYLYIQTGDIGSATESCLEVLQTDPELTEVHNLLGYLYLVQQRANEAMAECRMVLERNPEHPVAHFNLGLARLQTGDEDGATDEFREALRLNPNCAEAHARLGQQFLKRGEVDAGLDQARTALKIFPEFPEGLCILAEALALKGDESLLEEAALSCRKAAALKPGLPEPHSILGVIYGFMGKNQEAEAELLKTLELKPDSLEAHLNLAVLFRKTGQEEKAAFHLGRVSEIDPGFAGKLGLRGSDKIVPLKYTLPTGLSHPNRSS